MNLLARLYNWTLKRNIRTWASHGSIVASGAIFHPFIGLAIAGWYYYREELQVRNYGYWSVDSICDVLIPCNVATAFLFPWIAGVNMFLLPLAMEKLGW